jgi:GNAT superfamily N-acetyltransferase
MSRKAAGMASGMHDATFDIVLIFYVQDKALLARLHPDELGLGDGERASGHGEDFRFRVEAVTTHEDFVQLLEQIRLRSPQIPFLVISDCLTRRNQNDHLGPSELVLRIHAEFQGSPQLYGLVALAEDPAGRVHDVDRVVPCDTDRESFRTAIIGAAIRLRLKAPPPVRTATKPPVGVRVEVVQSLEQLRRCLVLRGQVYRELGYLPGDVVNDQSGLELDGYDNGSFHFAAMRADEIVGTARLTIEHSPDMPVRPSSDIGPEALHTRSIHERWCNQIARDAGPSIRRRYNLHPFFPLPILHSVEFHSRWANTLGELSHAAELSRMIVAPPYRGYGIATLLIKAVIAKAYQVKRRVLLTESNPRQLRFFANFGFRPLDQEPHSSPYVLNKLAVVLWFRLDEPSHAAQSTEAMLREIQLGSSPFFGPLDVHA